MFTVFLLIFLVRVSGWSEVTPVSVDRVGIFFRRAMTATSTTDTSLKHPPIRVVFEVILLYSICKFSAAAAGFFKDFAYINCFLYL